MFRILFVLLFFSIKGFAQSALENFNNAAKAYENKDFPLALMYLSNSVTLLKTTNPKIESLKALCYYAQEDVVNSKISLDKYFKMVIPSQVSTENHNALLVINSSIVEYLKNAEASFNTKMFKSRLDKATQKQQEAIQKMTTKLSEKKQIAASRLYEVYNNTSNKQMYDKIMKNLMDKKEYETFQYSIKSKAVNKSVTTASEINMVLKKIINKKQDFHIFSDGPTADEGPFILQSIEFKGKIIDYVIVCKADKNITIKEKGTFQGLDLANLESYEVKQIAGGNFRHVFRFSSRIIWKSGNVKYSDGKSYSGDITYDYGHDIFSLDVPAEYSEEIKNSFESLIKSNKDAKGIKY